MNTKLERVSKEIAKTKGKIASQQARLRDLERQKISLENEEIVALFRREKLSEDEFSALLRAKRGSEDSTDIQVAPEVPNMEGDNESE